MLKLDTVYFSISWRENSVCSLQLFIHLFSSLLTSTCTKMLSLQNLITNSTAARENHYFVNLGVVHPCLCSYLPHKNILCAYTALCVYSENSLQVSHQPYYLYFVVFAFQKKMPSVLIGYWFYWDSHKLYIVYNNKKKQCFYEQIHSFFTFQWECNVMYVSKILMQALQCLLCH